MNSNSHLLIKKQPGRGWFISRNGQKIGAATNVVDAIDFANRFSEREYALYHREVRVLFVDEKSDEEIKSPD